MPGGNSFHVPDPGDRRERARDRHARPPGVCDFRRRPNGGLAAAIAAALSPLNVGPGSLVLTQGARGTDLLVAEEALRRGADVRVYLALPVDEFIARSVDLPRSRWSVRFRDVLAASEAVVQSEAIGPAADDNVFDRNNRWVLDEATALASHTSTPAHAVVVWDGAEGDGAGGTAGFVHEARERGIGVDVINPRQAWRDPNVPYWERQPADEPKRLLALDGGGMRGLIFALQILRRMEEETFGNGDPDLPAVGHLRLRRRDEHGGDHRRGDSPAALGACGDHREDVLRARDQRSSASAGLAGEVAVAVPRLVDFTDVLQGYFGQRIVMIGATGACARCSWPSPTAPTATRCGRSRPTSARPSYNDRTLDPLVQPRLPALAGDPWQHGGAGVLPSGARVPHGHRESGGC